MSRYHLSHQQAADLVAYLKELDQEHDPGVTDNTIVLGVVLPPESSRGVMLIVLDHGSTDGTAPIIHEVAREHPGRIHYQRREDPVWREATIRQGLIEDGRKLGGTHFWVIDADELATGNVLPQIRPMLSALEPGDFITIPWFPIWGSLDRCRRDGNDYWCANRTAYGFRDHPETRYEARKNRPVCDMHTRAPISPGRKRECWLNDLERGAMHFVAAGRSRLVAKTAWYKMLETVRFSDVSAERLNAIYNRELDETGLTTVPVEPAWWAPYLRWCRACESGSALLVRMGLSADVARVRAGEIRGPRSLGSFLSTFRRPEHLNTSSHQLPLSRKTKITKIAHVPDRCQPRRLEVSLCCCQAL